MRHNRCKVKEAQGTYEWIKQVGLPLGEMIWVTMRLREHDRNTISTVMTRRAEVLRGNATNKGSKQIQDSSREKLILMLTIFLTWSTMGRTKNNKCKIRGSW